MNQTNKLLNKIKDKEIDNQENIPDDEVDEEEDKFPKGVTEDNLDEYLRNVETDEYSKNLLEKYLKNKEK